MKVHILAILMLCLLLAGCGAPAAQPEAPTQATAVETQTQETASAETDEAEVVPVAILPLPDTTMDAMEDGILNVSIGQGDFFREDGGEICLHVQIYSYDKFDMVDIAGMKEGDMLLLCGEGITVNKLERNEFGTILVNGGLDEGGVDLASDDSGIYYAQGYSDVKYWNLLGENQFPVSENFVFTDCVDPEAGEVTYSAGELVENLPGTEYGYQPQNTTVRIENGQVVAMERIYTP